MLGRASRYFFHALAGSRQLQRLASGVGMRKPTSFARRFVAGETIGEALDVARAVQADGFLLTLDYLGENVTNLAEATASTKVYLDIVRRMIAAGVDRNISLKLTSLGLDADKASAVDNLRKILEHAEPAGFFVRLDMESSHYTEITLEIFETLWHHGHRSLGVVLQAALRRSEQDLQRLSALGARIRLVKGAYTEPKTIAYAKKSDVDAAFARMTKILLGSGTYPAIATHDDSMIELARREASALGLAPERYEFQMLYGIRRDLQTRLLGAGHRVRVYIPFGRQWFPYFMRRLGERPANLSFVIRSVVREQR
jgi:proline dehydrogenase